MDGETVQYYALYNIFITHRSVGRSSMKQFVPLKPTKRGFKVWVRADAVTGFFCDFDVYVGRPSDAQSPEVGLGERVVRQLCRPLQEGNYQIFCDNFFSTCSLFDDLRQQKIYACGTARMDRRGFPDTLKGVVLPERGQSVSCQRGNLVATVWQDKKPVKVLSTMCDPTETASVQRRQKDGSKVTVPCPAAVVAYNKYMGGVDKGDQLRHYYCFRLKCVENYKYIFWFMLDVAVTNGHILSHFSPTTTSLRSLKAFRLRLAEELIGSYCSCKRAGRPCPTKSLPHPPPPLPSPDEDGPPASQRPRITTPLHLPSHQDKKRCVYCREYRPLSRRRETVWFCKECEGRPALCLTGKEDGSDCFRLWHMSIF